MFPTKEAGDYFNNNVILIKYQLDLADPDGIMEKYSIRAYPTFIFVDGDGKEYARFLGGASDTKAFLERTQNAIKPENSWAYREAKLKSDPSYTMEHIKFLNSIYMQDPAKELLNKYFATRNVKENFSEESLQLYNSLITDTNSPIVDYMLSHQKEVSEVMGEEKYKSFLTSKANRQLESKLMRLDLEKPENLVDFENELKKINANPLFKSQYTTFVADNLHYIKSKNMDAIFENSKKIIPNLNSSERLMIIALNGSAPRFLKITLDQTTSTQRMIPLYEIAVACEKDPGSLASYQRTLERLKNPQ